MKKKEQRPTKEHYQRLRLLTCEQLWTEEVPVFDKASPQERIERVSVVRAVGVAFSESGTPAQKERARQWLFALLQDPAEKIRRYAMVALPKIGAGETEEAALLTLLRKTPSDREKKFLAQTLEKIGGTATLETRTDGKYSSLDRTAQKVEANLARVRHPSTIRFENPLRHFKGLQIHLHGRSGLERLISEELQEQTKVEAKFRIIHSETGMLTITPRIPFKLADIYALRCFSTTSLVLGTVPHPKNEGDIAALASVIASHSARRIFETFTGGPLRYRLEFVSKGHQRSAVRALAQRVYTLCPKLLNDSRNAPWEIGIYPAAEGCSVELSPKLRPDPRFYYRSGDVPAASHPPLAACMARLAGREENETVWDPFCGSGLELIERALRGGVREIFATDRSEEAIATAQANIAAARLAPLKTTFACCDFRDYTTVLGLGTNTVSLVITNPPMGRRVPIANLHGLIRDLFNAASAVLRPGGRLVFVNPLTIEPEDRSLKLQFRQKVDLGGFSCRMEKYVKQA